MIIDKRLQIANAVVMPTTATTTVIGDVIDVQGNTLLRDIGVGEPLYLVISVAGGTGAGGTSGWTTTSNAGSAYFILTMGTDASLSSPQDILQSPAYAIDLVSSLPRYKTGTVMLCVALPSISNSLVNYNKQYLGIRCVTVTQGFTGSSSVNIEIVRDVSRWTSYADSSVIGSV